MTLRAPWSPADDIATLFNCVRKCQLFATRADEEIPEAKIVRDVHFVLTQSGVFGPALFNYNQAHPESTRTYVDMVEFFTRADNQRHLDATAAPLVGAPRPRERINEDAHIQALIARSVQLALAAAGLPNAPPAPANGRAPTNGRAPDTRPTNYCHTHGVTTNPHHTSATCRNPGPNHNAAATNENRMNGSNVQNQHRRVDPQV